jgi:hypothetical protein
MRKRHPVCEHFPAAYRDLPVRADPHEGDQQVLAGGLDERAARGSQVGGQRREVAGSLELFDARALHPRAIRQRAPA